DGMYPEKYHGGNEIKPMEGKSLVPVIKGASREPHEVLHWAHEGNHAIRSGKWKLVMEKGSPWELYDMEADRTELNDLADAKPEVMQELRRKFENWAEKVGV
ncbi:MAG: arylsulfatase, partial [Planctomycetes bacterium]|nr:arylsulfatase [Planctomycetota bacterium]